jgi:hypothetical protein
VQMGAHTHTHTHTDKSAFHLKRILNRTLLLLLQWQHCVTTASVVKESNKTVNYIMLTALTIHYHYMSMYDTYYIRLDMDWWSIEFLAVAVCPCALLISPTQHPPYLDYNNLYARYICVIFFPQIDAPQLATEQWQKTVQTDTQNTALYLGAACLKSIRQSQQPFAMLAFIFWLQGLVRLGKRVSQTAGTGQTVETGQITETGQTAGAGHLKGLVRQQALARLQRLVRMQELVRL